MSSTLLMLQLQLQRFHLNIKVSVFLMGYAIINKSKHSKICPHIIRAMKKCLTVVEAFSNIHMYWLYCSSYARILRDLSISTREKAPLKPFCGFFEYHVLSPSVQYLELNFRYYPISNTRSTETTKHLELLPLPGEQTHMTRLDYSIFSIIIPQY